MIKTLVFINLLNFQRSKAKEGKVTDFEQYFSRRMALQIRKTTKTSRRQLTLNRRLPSWRQHVTLSMRLDHRLFRVSRTGDNKGRWINDKKPSLKKNNLLLNMCINSFKHSIKFNLGVELKGIHSIIARRRYYSRCLSRFRKRRCSHNCGRCRKQASASDLTISSSSH